MEAAPGSLIGRDREWRALGEFVDGGRGVALVYGQHHAGVSHLLESLANVRGGRVHRCAPGTRHVQLNAMARFLDENSVGDPRPLTGWASAFERLRRLSVPLVVIDDLPHLLPNGPDLAEALARYHDAGHGPVLVLGGTSQPAMLGLLSHGSPLFGRVSLAVTPSPLVPADVARLWEVERPATALWVDAVVGGMPGYRPLLPTPGEKLSSWMRHEVLTSRSALVDSTDAGLADRLAGVDAGLGRSVLDAVAWGASSPDAVAAEVGVGVDEAASALNGLERAGSLIRVRDVLRERRDSYEVADPHLRFWSTVIAPNRADLVAGRGHAVWAAVRDSVWRTQVLRRRWEEVVRRHVATVGVGPWDAGPVALVGRSAGLDVVATDANRNVVGLGRVALSSLGLDDLAVLDARRRELGLPDTVSLVLASTVRVDAAAVSRGAVAITPGDVYTPR